MSHNKVRTKLQPYRLLTCILYGDYSFVEWKSSTRVKIRNGAFSRMLRVSNSKVREYLRYLQDLGYFSDLNTDHGWAEFTVRFPPRRGDDF